MQNEMENKAVDMPEAVEGNVGPVDYSLDYSDGKVVIKVGGESEHVKGALMVEVDAKAIIDTLVKSTETKLDDAAADFILERL